MAAIGAAFVVSWVLSRLTPTSDCPPTTAAELEELETVRPLVPAVPPDAKNLPLPVLLDRSSSTAAAVGDESLRLAVESGDPKRAAEVLARPDTDINRFFDRFSYRHTALFIATKLGKIDLMRLLLNAGADPNLICTSTQIYERDTLDFHETALYHAVRTKKLDAARELLSYPATDVNVVCRHEYVRGEEEWGEDIETMTFRALDVVPVGPAGESIAAEIRDRGGLTAAKLSQIRSAGLVDPSDPIWTDEGLLQALGSEYRLSAVEVELTETRSIPAVKDFPLSKFLGMYRTKELYSVSQMPRRIQSHYKLFPFLSCGGWTYHLFEPVLWMAGGRTRSVIHQDSQHNQHCVIDGSKRFIIWPADSGIDSDAFGWIDVEDFPEHKEQFPQVYGAFAARVNISDMDLKAFPAWSEAVWWEATLEAGDCLYMPPWWFHHVESGTNRTVSSHIWFNKPLTWYGFASTCDDERNPSSTVLSDCEFYDTTGKDTRASFASQTSACGKLRKQHEGVEL
ncbi:hypothetical protein FOZ63_012718 [Perkinsus olseni]|uniref:JmjC domain-containing protein n=1 Tax=Perkinsus olseni TaxID=32597 RepID=A0A7J6QES4_PEROL|nr:hypothetical protein FOZ62_013470 [Perkinsus olseni]KAF4726283.1 hypothetical protein FOZ63_012718 [Perkinsus olseni]